jgi:hypothetical protein
MDPQLAEIFGPVLAILGVGSMILIGVKMRYTHLRHTRHSQLGQEDVERLNDDVASLREDFRMLREEFVDLYERVEFTERVLAQGKGGNGGMDALPRGERH